MMNLLKKIFMVDLIQGMAVTFGYQNPKKIYTDRKSTRLNSSHIQKSRMPSSA